MFRKTRKYRRGNILMASCGLSVIAIFRARSKG